MPPAAGMGGFAPLQGWGWSLVTPPSFWGAPGRALRALKDARKTRLLCSAPVSRSHATFLSFTNH